MSRQIRMGAAAVAVLLGLAACSTASHASSARSSTSAGTSGMGSMTASSAVLTPEQIFKRSEPGIFEIYGQADPKTTAWGTGFIIDKAGAMAVTNAHVVQGLTALKARLSDGTLSALHVMAVDPCTDLAVVHFGDPLPSSAVALSMGTSAALQEGDQVVALGYPESLASDPLASKLAITTGLVQGTKVRAAPADDLPEYANTIQHGATLNHGNSGGPLLDEHGQVVGINTLTNAANTQGQYYSIAIDSAKPELDKLMAGKSQDYLGWSLLPLSMTPMTQMFPIFGFGTAAQGAEADKLLAQSGVDGMFVTDVDAGSNVEKAHLGQGDLVRTIQGAPVTTTKQVCDVISSILPGTVIRVTGNHLTSASGMDHFGDAFTVEFATPGKH